MNVRFNCVSKIYDGTVKAVDSLNITIKKHSLHFILGPSGCGKTTTLRLLAGLEKVSSGEIFFGNKNVTKLTPKERKIGMVFQNYALWPHMSVEDNIKYGLKIKKLAPSLILEKSNSALKVTQLLHLKDRFPSQLSGGQQQRVALARAIAIEPSLLLLDEPLSNLDAKLRTEMRENILKVHDATKLTTIYVTHDQKEALSMGTHITVMNAGREVQTGSPRKLYDNPCSYFLADFIGEANFIDGLILENTDKYIVDTPLGTIHAYKKNYHTFKKGDKIKLSIRPQHIQIQTEKDNKQNTFTAAVQSKIYLGDSEQLELISHNKAINLSAIDFAFEQKELQLNSDVFCYIDPKNIHLLNS
jgi:iron(III) transport system ATP-binding protein